MEDMFSFQREGYDMNWIARSEDEVCVGCSDIQLSVLSVMVK